MNTDEHGSKLNEIAEATIGCSFAVSNALGAGFNEKVYENSLVIELRTKGLRVDQQIPFEVKYRDQIVGQYVVDLVVEGSVLVELKAIDALSGIHTAQCINYLKASGLKLCLLLNFGKPKLEVKRVAL